MSANLLRAIKASWHVILRGSVAARLPNFLGAIVAIALASLLFGIVSPGFVSIGNFLNLLDESGPLCLLALGQMFAILVRGFDVSVGAAAALASVCAVVAVNHVGDIGLLAAPLVGLGAGMINGVLVGIFDVQPIISTLGMMLVLRGLALFATGEEQIVQFARGLQPPGLAMLRDNLFDQVPVSFCIVFVAVTAVAFVVRKLRFGRRLYMVGSDPQSAALVGVSVKSTVVGAYALCGLGAGCAGLFLLARSGVGMATEASGMELQSIAAAIIGGVALTGGVGSPFGTLLGALFVEMLTNGLNLLGVSPFFEEITTGAVILGAGAFSPIFHIRKRRIRGTEAVRHDRVQP
ncbi:MAG: ABC transporter permease [Xanthobacteraceae bacterium]